jgi:hypothetical protein
MGDLNLNNNNIYDVNTINNIVFDSHSYRHLPNGEDPLATAAPSTILATTVSNSEGVANSFARSDHTHVLDVSSININSLNAQTPLSVSNGGTGKTTLESGKFLVGNGVSGVSTTKTVPTGDVVGTTDSMILRNKNLVTNSVNFIDETDSTKTLKFSTNNNATGVTSTLCVAATTNQILTLPNITNDTLVGAAAAQTLSNKTLVSDSNFNVWLGTGAGNNRNSLYNTSIGNLALNNIDNFGISTYNTCVGHMSLASLTTGTHNVALGSQTGNTIVTGSNCTLIGDCADVVSSSDTNAIAIGQNVISTTNTATIGNSSITSIVNAGDGTCDLATTGMTTSYVLGLPVTDGSEGTVLVRQPAANSSRWGNTWVDLGSTTLETSENSLNVTLSTSNMKFIKIYFYSPGSSAATPLLRFNNDSTNGNYGYITSTNGTSITGNGIALRGTNDNTGFYGIVDVRNVAGTKPVVGNSTAWNGTTIQNSYISGVCTNENIISNIQVVTDTGTFVAGTEIEVWGSN